MRRAKRPYMNKYGKTHIAALQGDSDEKLGDLLPGLTRSLLSGFDNLYGRF